jgi:hypothetical protein
MQSTILFLSKDIFFWPVVKKAVAEWGVQLEIISKLDQIIADELAKAQYGCCLIDLSFIELATLQSIVNAVRIVNGRCYIIAFGSHVHESRLAEAEKVGCDLVLTRGQFSSNVAKYLSSGLQRASSEQSQ